MEKTEYLNKLESLLKRYKAGAENIEAAKAYAENLIELELPIIFNTKHLAALVGVEAKYITSIAMVHGVGFYNPAMIPKKNGGIRELDIPSLKLKQIQRWILKNILNKINVSKCATGFCKGRSIVTNAEYHLGCDCVVNMDIEGFFPSITREQVFRVFYYYGYTTEISFMLSELCTYNGFLPQGAPTSPRLSNIICLKLDKRLSRLAEKYEAKYSRYADDITFSGSAGIQGIVDIASSVLSDEGFNVNQKKTRILFKHQRQEITGLTINGSKVSVPKKYLKSFLQEIYYCKKYGVADHLDHIGCTKRFFKEHMYGKAYFINMVDNKLGQELLQQLDEIDWEG